MNHLVVFIIIGAVAYFAFRFNIILGFAFLAFVGFIMYRLNLASFLEMRANAMMQEKEYKTALEYYEKAYKSKNRKFTVDIAYARALVRVGQSEKALEVLNAILGLNLTKQIKVMAKETRCLVNYKLGELDEAYEEAYDLYYETGHTTSTMQGLLGFLMIEKNGVTGETKEFCEKAYDYDSDNRDIVDNLAVCYYQSGEYEKGFELCKKLNEEYPLFVEGWYHGAQILEKLGDRKRALEFAEKALECDRNPLTTIPEKDIELLVKKLG